MSKDRCNPHSSGAKSVKPIYRNIHVLRDFPHYRFPLPAIVSILHRMSGVILLGALALLLLTLQISLASEQGFLSIQTKLAHPLVKAALLVFIWAFLHHLCAGIRYLLLDMHQGIDLKSARQSSMLVLVVSVLLTLIIWIRLW